MIVLDASAVVDLLLNLSPRSNYVTKRIRKASSALYAPYLLDAEVAQVLRRYTLRGELSNKDAESALNDLADMPITRYPHGPFLKRAFELRDNVTIYDALYLVLAESLNAVLLTSDVALASVPGCHSLVELTTG